MNIIVVYNGIGKIAVDQLKKLVNEKDDTQEGKPIGTIDRSVDVIGMEELVFIDNSKADIINDKIIFVGDVKGGKDLIPISKPAFSKFGVIYSFAGPQAVLTVNPKKLKKAETYCAFYKELKALTYHQISKAPTGLDAIKDILAHGILGYKRRQENIMKQQFIYGITKLYYKDLQKFLFD